MLQLPKRSNYRRVILCLVLSFMKEDTQISREARFRLGRHLWFMSPHVS
jgi:hypothetical protein